MNMTYGQTDTVRQQKGRATHSVVALQVLSAQHKKLKRKVNK